MTIPFANPSNGEALELDGKCYRDCATGKPVAQIVNSIPRFLGDSHDYADSFGYQWKKWVNTLSEARGSKVKHRDLVMQRSLFDQFDCLGKTILECGMGGGDDTEALLSLPFAEVHSFDISESVERANACITDRRLVISQASIFEIPYKDEQFDFVFCHRVIMHTPDPINAIECICKKLKFGGVLFIHSYKKTAHHMSEFRYRYRRLANKLPKKVVYLYVQLFGWPMHIFSSVCQKAGRFGRTFRHRFVPWYYVQKIGEYSDVGIRDRVELEKLITFDALTPAYDNPITTEELVCALHANKIEIINLEDRHPSLVYATGTKQVR